MNYGAIIFLSILVPATAGFAKETKTGPVTIDTIDSDTLVSQVWNPNPSPVEAIVLKRRQRAKK
ncbi:MAG: hypothetical protein JKX71_04355 [Amylibacter sp.]|nr:hypothetical protein [Amylibacter sp.]